MPIYEYRCESCQQVVEAMQSMSEAPLQTCEECGGKLRKLFSAPAFQFKGSGWYVTDYARKDGKRDGGDSKTGDSASGGGDTKSDGSKSDGAKSEGAKKAEGGKDGASSKSSSGSGSPAADSA